ncbi:MAG TPA: hypothetical protein VJ912_00900 [Candidatus Nanoarchaeia archaeon]|nr:hypothetical protein [Candidatus Nanoarchaeia archaeon]
MDFTIYNKSLNQNIKFLKKVSEDNDYIKIFSDKIDSNSVFYNIKKGFTIYIKIHETNNKAYFKVDLYCKKENFAEYSKEILSQIPEGKLQTSKNEK